MSMVEEFTRESMRQLDRVGCIILDDEEIEHLSVTRLTPSEYRVTRHAYAYQRGVGYVLDMDGDSDVMTRGKAEAFVRSWHDMSEQLASL